MDCSCIHAPVMNLTTGNIGIQYEAINTSCNSTCSHLWLFIVLAFCNMFMTFLCTMPALSSTLRVVRDDQRSFALGVQWIKVRILGTIPAPMVFGALIDDTCILWNETCEGRGACLVYDNYYMSRLANSTIWRLNNARCISLKSLTNRFTHYYTINFYYPFLSLSLLHFLAHREKKREISRFNDFNQFSPKLLMIQQIF